MKIIFISDIHGLITNFKKIENIINSMDKIIVLGDSFYNYRYDIDAEENPDYLIEYFNKNKEKIIYINGNCDQNNILNFKTYDYYTLNVDNKTFKLIHGHRQYLYPEQNEYLIYGHTHIPEMRKTNNAFILNPGSLSLPKAGTATYMIYQSNNFIIYDVEGNIIKEMKTN